MDDNNHHDEGSKHTVSGFSEPSFGFEDDTAHHEEPAESTNDISFVSSGNSELRDPPFLGSAGSAEADASLPRPVSTPLTTQSRIKRDQGFLSPISNTPMTSRTRVLAKQEAVPTTLQSLVPFSTTSNPTTDFPPAAGAQLGKRRREDLEADDGSLSSSNRPSKCATPDPASLSAPILALQASEASPFVELDESEYAAVATMLGTTSEEEIRSFLKEQEQAVEAARLGRLGNEARLRQERADEEFARQLQSAWNDDSQHSTPHQPHYNQAVTNNAEQITPWSSERDISRSGDSLTFSPMSSSLRMPADTTQEKRNDVPIPGILTSGSSTAASGSLQRTDEPPVFGFLESDDDLEIIDSSQFRGNDRRGKSNTQDLTSWSRFPASVGGTGFTEPGGARSTEYVYGQDFSRPTTMENMHASRQPFDRPAYHPTNHSLNPFDATGSFISAGNVPQPNYSLGYPSLQTTSHPNALKTYMGWNTDSNDNQYYNHGDYSTGAENTEALKDLLNNIRPDEEANLGAGESERDCTPEGMADTATLYKYQQKGLAWLTKMEEGTNKGGILADDMGLGKTIQAIALMVSRRSKNPRCKTNLIIAPVALVQQWENEIRNKLKRSHALSVLVYHGAGKGSMTWETLRSHDVVISTYGTLALDYKKKLECEQKKRSDPDYQPQKGEIPVLTGSECKFHRCILDEAQNIKNRSTKAALAAHEVSAEYRLCMTGTPMMNNVIELFSLIHFLRIRPYCQWEKFNSDFARPLKAGYATGRQRAMTKLQALCKAIMLRRTKKSQMDGKPLVSLPERHTNSDYATFDEDEQAFYNALEAKTQLTFNKYLKAGTVGRNYSNVLTLLLRLRQACCHPHLIQDFAVSVEASPEQLLDNARDLPQAVVDRLIANAIADCPVCMDTANNYTIFNPCGHSTCSECFCSLCDTSRNPNATLVENAYKAKFTCHACRSEVDPMKVTDYVSFKRIHEPVKAAEEGLEGLEGLAGSTSESDPESESESESESDSLDGFIVPDNQPAEANGDSEDSNDDLDRVKPIEGSNSRKVQKRQPRPTIGNSNDQSQGMKAEVRSALDAGLQEVERSRKQSPSVKNEKSNIGDDLTGHSGGDNPFEKAKRGASQKRRSRKHDERKSRTSSKKTLAQLKKESMRNAAAKREYFKRLNREFIPSGKISKCIEILRGIMSAPEREKVIIFSQFTSLLDLLEIPINRNHWDYRRFDGSMSSVQRGKSITDFTQDQRTRLLLVSLKAGNAGLNLTAASQVIILDPFWNPYIEEQAIDRAHRIGQRRPVQVHRILVPETVEDRILKLQDQKRELIEGALDEGASSHIGRLGVRELGYLFGVHS